MQPQILPLSGAQMKKKSGFQITSVTPAQISVSTNNSITEDTESCDDLDESHTEDLSSSEIMDVSLSRTADKGGADRSSSEETLNSFHEAETPGAMSPNQPPLHHSLTHPQGTLMNGSAHHQPPQYHHQCHHVPPKPTSSAASISGQSVSPMLTTVSAAVTSSTGALPIVGQKMPLNVGGILENASASTTGLMGPPSAASAPGATAGGFSAVSGATICNANSSNVSNISMPSSACVPVVGAISTSISNVVFPTGSVNSSSSQHVNLIQQHQQSGITGASGVLGLKNSGLPGASGAVQLATPGASLPGSHTQPQPQQQAPVTASSRFRVVKLDSNSEPFKKGRWTCTEYYDKETVSSTFASTSAPVVPAEPPLTQAVEAVRQLTDNTGAGFERDDVGLSSSSVSSSVSTLSHYSESVGSGDMGGPNVLQHTFQQSQDYTAVSPLNVQGSVPYQLRNSMTASPPVSLQQQQQTSSNLESLSTTSIPPHSAVSQQQQLSYGQTPPAQCVSQQLMGYPSFKQSAQPAQVAAAHGIHVSQTCAQSTDYSQCQHQVSQTSSPGSSHLLTPQTGSMPPASVAANGQMMTAAVQQPVGKVPTSAVQPLPLQSQPQPQQTSSAQMVQAAPHMVPLQRPKGPQLPVEQQQQQQPVSTQGLTQHSSGIATSLLSNVPPSMSLSNAIQNGTKDSGVPHSSAHTLCASLPSVTATQLEDAQRLLLQHQSLLALPILVAHAGECASHTDMALAPEGSGAVSTLTSSASLLKSLPVDGEDDR